MNIQECCQYLKLPYLRENWQEVTHLARLKEMNPQEFLELALNRECEIRKENAVLKRIQRARFPARITLDEFQRDHLGPQIRQMIRKLETLEFLENGQNVILIGNPGTGKTALSIALGIKSCQAGRSVLFVSVPTLLIELKEAMSSSQIMRYKHRFESYDLVILDEWGYCTFDQQAGEILFNLISGRNEKGSIILTSNLPLNEWESVFRDKVLTGAMIDRLTNMAYLIDMTGKSFRTIQTEDWMSKVRDGIDAEREESRK